jgi:hypothetical protein
MVFQLQDAPSMRSGNCGSSCAAVFKNTPPFSTPIGRLQITTGITKYVGEIHPEDEAEDIEMKSHSESLLQARPCITFKMAIMY